VTVASSASDAVRRSARAGDADIVPWSFEISISLNDTDGKEFFDAPTNRRIKSVSQSIRANDHERVNPLARTPARAQDVKRFVLVARRPTEPNGRR